MWTTRTAEKTLQLGVTASVDVVAEDADIFVMLVHYVPNSPKKFHFCTKSGRYNIIVV